MRIPAAMKTAVAIMESRAPMPMPQMPWPLVQPPPNRDPKPTMSPAIVRTTLEAALRQSDRVTWFYSEEGMSVWEPAQFTQDWMDAITAVRNAAQNPAPTVRYGIEDLHRVHQQPFDADLNGVIDLEDREAVEGECRLFENNGRR